MVEAQSVGERAATRDREGWVTGTLVLFCLASAIITVVAGLVQVTFGEYSMTFVEAWGAVFEPTVMFNLEAWSAFLFGTELPEMSTDSVVVWNLRLPRVFVAIIAGATLAISGAIFQAVTRNELASPFVLGVSSGAGFAVLATLVVFTGFAPYLPLIAAVGGTVAFLVVYGIAWKGGTSPVRLVLAGVIVNMVFQSLQQGLFFFVDDLGVAQTAIAWLTGSFTGTGWGEVRIALIPGIASIAVALASSRQLNVLLLGETTAKSLGMRVERVRFFLSAVAILAASVAIAVAGIVSFFGLVVPHIVRNVVGGDYRQLMVGCLFAGPALMVTADVGARLALGGMQMPVGVVTGLVGGPYFLYLMRKQQSMGEL
ncbi:transport system permease protein [Haloterrigena turkmenica DSM 5511]|uniref:Cobalamin import system permease protein BtuC n=1 Tax=Haloterrigena turkmenica (strain ATCC 51198 / DSM 5511 / JCM 9101 / NCIMB 13204 / VKM B-1734 / 4k) TaxID=543526 RepID=D2RUD6_HALTV|nr:iron ABC transporter permease [Haloterrigena turkmenica]ADB59205.1 transport system permease protein [Haloterrigena turkmenica DSM 5511]